MSGVVLFEHSHRGNVWRLEVATHNGHTFLNWRKWYWDGEAFKPTREGCTIPLERLPDLMDGVASWLSGDGASEAEGTP
ncbi:hypothetical protein [Emcibacter sp. SYSU 3D8]|uniref:hypothetical protein n=1 Tax=Emcibacter sp. SYSU 3D8 TaxID=3133969 RepID=UPI0031FE77F6